MNIFATLTSDPDAGATDGKVSQLERLVFSENFVKEEAEEGAGGHSRAKLPCLDQSDKQATFSRHFGQVQSQILLLVSRGRDFTSFFSKSLPSSTKTAPEKCPLTLRAVVKLWLYFPI